jgi:histidinol-phosphate aminotransferase
MKKSRISGGINRREFIGTITGAAALALIGLDRRAVANVAAGGDSIARDFMARICFNENPIGPSPEAANAIIAAAYLTNRYPDWFGESLIAALAARYNLSTDRFICGSGGTEMLRLCAMTFSQPGGNVIVPNPSYTQFPSDCELFGRTVRYVSLDQDYRINLQAIANRVDGGTTAICLTNPNNPTGTLLDDGELTSFVQALDDDIVVIIDEAYLEYIDDENYTSAVELVRNGRNVVLVKTFSKVYGLAGARIGYAVSRSSNISAMRQYQIISTISKPCLEGAKAALTDQAHVDQTVQLAADMKAYCFQHFGQMGLSYIPSQASFFMVNVNTDADYVRSLLEERQIFVRTGWGMSQYLRVSTGTPNEMERFVYELDHILSSMPKNGVPIELKSTALFQASPNPFNSSTVIRIYLPQPQETRLDIYDINGRLINRLADGILGTGEHAFIWNGVNSGGSPVATGAYFYRLISGENVITRKMLLIK